MALSSFDDKARKPKPSDLTLMLGRSSTHWDYLIEQLAAEYAPLDQTWQFSGANWGWSLRLRQKKRTILYMTPCRKHFLVGFVLGAKAIKVARAARLPASVLRLIDAAKKYPEGKALRLEIRTKQDRAVVMKIAAAKMAT
jgi:hypothetical protein